jgi:Prokaryotic E2 family E
VTVIEQQLDQLRARYPEAEARSQTDGSYLIQVPQVELPAAKWNQAKTDVYFIAPAGYPVARPDCFWADFSLRLANGGLPQNSSPQPTPFGMNLLWFSWHLTTWNPRDTLQTFLAVIQERFERGN